MRCDRASQPLVLLPPPPPLLVACPLAFADRVAGDLRVRRRARAAAEPAAHPVGAVDPDQRADEEFLRIWRGLHASAAHHGTGGHGGAGSGGGRLPGKLAAATAAAAAAAPAVLPIIGSVPLCAPPRLLGRPLRGTWSRARAWRSSCWPRRRCYLPSPLCSTWPRCLRPLATRRTTRRRTVGSRTMSRRTMAKGKATAVTKRGRTGGTCPPTNADACCWPWRWWSAWLALVQPLAVAVAVAVAALLLPMLHPKLTRTCARPWPSARRSNAQVDKR